jgi:erythromycin esterase-like protein
VCRGVERFDVSDPKLTHAFDVIREKLLLPVWKRKVTMDLAEWLQENKNRLSAED